MRKSDHIHLVDYKVEERVIKTQTDVIIFSLSSQNSLTSDYAHRRNEGFRLFNLGLKNHEKAFILKIKTLYTHNDSLQSIILTCKLDSTTTALGSSGTCSIVIPGNGFRGVVDPNSSLVYEPNMVNLGMDLFYYIGMEDHILKKKSTVVAPDGIDKKSYDVFRFTDPLVVFLLQYRHKFENLRSDDIMQTKEDATIYLVKKSLVERVQQLFQNAIFPLFKYKTDNTFELDLVKNKEQPLVGEGFVMVQVQIDYMVVSPRIINYETEGIKLKL